MKLEHWGLPASRDQLKGVWVEGRFHYWDCCLTTEWFNQQYAVAGVGLGRYLKKRFTADCQSCFLRSPALLRRSPALSLSLWYCLYWCCIIHSSGCEEKLASIPSEYSGSWSYTLTGLAASYLWGPPGWCYTIAGLSASYSSRSPRLCSLALV